MLALALLGSSVSSDEIAHPYRLTPAHTAVEGLHRVRLLGALELAAITVDGYRMVELSGLGWDRDEGLLYALSDHGRLFHLRPVIADGRLVDVEVLGAYPLRDSAGDVLSGRAADSEGLATMHADNDVTGDTVLVISFERLARIASYSTEGQLLGTLPLPPPLDQAPRYDGINKGLEAVTTHPTHGFLTAPEFPLRDSKPDVITLYASDGVRWVIPRYHAPASALVDLELLHDGSLITLERSFRSVWQPLFIILRRIPRLGEPSEELLAIEDIAIFNSFEGWRIDNFEGLTHHQGSNFFIVSDNNDKALQRTLLVYFEILPAPLPPVAPQRVDSAKT